MPTDDLTAAAIAAFAAEVAKEQAGHAARRRRLHEHPLMDDHAWDGLQRKRMALIPAKSLRLGGGPLCK